MKSTIRICPSLAIDEERPALAGHAREEGLRSLGGRVGTRLDDEWHDADVSLPVADLHPVR